MRQQRTALAAAASFLAAAIASSGAHAGGLWPFGYGAPTSGAVSISTPGFAASASFGNGGYAGPEGYYAAPAAYPAYAYQAPQPYAYHAPVAYPAAPYAVAPVYAAPQPYVVSYPHAAAPTVRKIVMEETRSKTMMVKHTRTRVIKEQWR